MAYSYVWSQAPQDLKSIIDLRTLCYHRVTAGKSEKSYLVTDRFDQLASFLMVFHGKKLIASLRVILPTHTDHVEQLKYLADSSSLPPLLEIAEVTRICIHPDYRKKNLLPRILQETLLWIVRNGRRWMVGSTPKKLWPFYKKLQAVDTGHRYLMKDHAIELIVVKMDLIQSILGEKVNPLIWGIFGKNLYHLLKKEKLIRPTFLDEMRVTLYTFISYVPSLLFKAAVRSF